VTPPRLLCGDCLDLLATLEEASVDVVVTSPPYNLGLGYATYRDSREEAEYLDWMVRVAEAVRRVMRPDASFFLNISGSSARPWLPFEQARHERSPLAIPHLRRTNAKS